MRKVITISLNGNAYQIEEGGHDASTRTGASEGEAPSNRELNRETWLGRSLALPCAKRYACIRSS